MPIFALELNETNLVFVNKSVSNSLNLSEYSISKIYKSVDSILYLPLRMDFIADK